MPTLTTDLALRSATELTAALRRRQVGSRELLRHYLERIDRLNPAINAVVTLDDTAFDRAEEADVATSLVRRGDRCTGCRSPSRTPSRRPVCAPQRAP